MTARVVGIGELLWDEGADGRSPGGAPANYAAHAAALGAEAAVVSAVGDDADGRAIVGVLRGYAVDVSAVGVASAPTGRVTVSGEPPAYTIHQPAAWDSIAVSDATRRVIADADAVCFGTLGQRGEPSRSSIRELLRTVKPGCLRVFDVNRREPFYGREVLEASFPLADVVKLNADELDHLRALFGLPAGEREAMAELLRRYGLKAVVLTRAERGSALLTPTEWSDRTGVPVRVVNTVGAGDSFAAAVTLGLLAGRSADAINAHAAAVAAAVCTRRDSFPPLAD